MNEKMLPRRREPDIVVGAMDELGENRAPVVAKRLRDIFAREHPNYEVQVVPFGYHKLATADFPFNNHVASYDNLVILVKPDWTREMQAKFEENLAEHCRSNGLHDVTRFFRAEPRNDRVNPKEEARAIGASMETARAGLEPALQEIARKIVAAHEERVRKAGF
jgi:hypothetical protein